MRFRFLTACILVVSYSFSVSALEPPSLEDAMLRQSIVDRKAIITMGKLAVQNKYEAKQLERGTITRGFIQSVQWEEKKQEEAHARVDDFSRAIDSTPGVDMERVRNTWLSWSNEVRNDLGRVPYIYDSRLDDTARLWALTLRNRDERNANEVHKRNPGDSYYDYSKITDWFEEYGVVGVVRNRVTTTENVGFGYYKCSQSDCTDELIEAIRGTFNFFMSEKSYNGSHYRSIVQPNFTKIGFSVQIDSSMNRFYLVIHYITDFE